MSSASEGAEINFSLYRKPELAERVAALVSLPGVLRTIIKCGAAVVLAMWAVLAVLQLTGQLPHWSVCAVLFVYGTIVAALCGAALGCLIALNRALDHVVEVFDLALETTEQASRDLAELREGDKTLPGPGKVLAGVHEHVLLPLVKGALRGQSRLLAWLMFPVLRWTLGVMLRRVVQYLDNPQAEWESAGSGKVNAPFDARRPIDEFTTGVSWACGEAAESEVNVVTLDAPAATDNVVQIMQWLSAARSYVTGYGHALRRAAITPLSVLCGVAAVVAFAPAVLAWCLAS